MKLTDTVFTDKDYLINAYALKKCNNTKAAGCEEKPIKNTAVHVRKCLEWIL